VDGQQLARVEHESFGSAGQLEEVGHPALLAPDLDDVAELHAGRGTGNLAMVWHEQAQAS
jgi:hypothetical protein